MFPSFQFDFSGRMPDYRSRLMEGINFDSPEEDQNPFSSIQEPPESKTSFTDLYRELVNRSNGPAMEAYRKFLDKGIPQQQKPSGITRLGAILSGLSTGLTNPSRAFDASRSVINEPYDRQLQQWQLEGNRLAQGANLEETRHRSDITSLRDVGNLMDKDEDNKRADRLANSVISNRTLNAERTRQLIENNGAKFELDKSTGIGYIVKLDGTKKEIGKFDQSTGERLADTFKKQENSSRLAAGRQGSLEDKKQKNRILFEGTRQANRKEVINLTNTNRKEFEAERQKNRKEIQEKAIKAAADRAKGGATSSTMNAIRKNLQKVHSIVDTDPDKYKDIWDEDTNTLTNSVPEQGTPEYEAYVSLYNALYEGVNQLSGKTTKGGNTIIRR